MDFVVRELEERDLEKGFLETLNHLRSFNLDIRKAGVIFKKIKSNPYYKIFVAINEDGKVIGSTTLLIEQKFIHEGGLVGHIEDVVTHKDFRSMGVGKAVMQKAIDAAKDAGCYKVILNCNDENFPFYGKLGFRKHGREMRLDLK
ncbi:MAG: GNAT family N-acetyltransferase [Candidatus Aenigmarchaeota archaeon]|nr:GNAT family N-acetyltransferase [Candidatus Aenigmarchaeota archaeon]